MPHHGTAVLAAAVFYLQNILVRFVLALALRYLLTPLIGAIQYCRVPRGLAILLAFGAAVGGLVALGVLVTRSVVAFSTHAAVYHERIDQLLGTAVNATLTIQQTVGGTPIDFSDKQALLSIASNVNVSDLILHTLRSFAHLTEVLTPTLALALAPAPALALALAPALALALALSLG
jgi:predicted PurR-regulated permease PerM